MNDADEHGTLQFGQKSDQRTSNDSNLKPWSMGVVLHRRKTGASLEDSCGRGRFGLFAKHDQQRVFFEVLPIPKSSDFSKLVENRRKPEATLDGFCWGDRKGWP